MKKKLPIVNLKLVSEPIEAGHPVSKEFRKALKEIAVFFEKNKSLHKNDYLVRPSVQQKTIELAKVLWRFRKLRARWTCEFGQKLEACYSADVEPELKTVLNRYIKTPSDL